MRWFKVWGSGLQTNPKWLALSLEERGAWITLMTIASALEPAWCFQGAEHAGMLLGREGAENAQALLDRLIEVRLLDVTDDGALVVHDYSHGENTHRTHLKPRVNGSAAVGQHGDCSRRGGEGHGPSRRRHDQSRPCRTRGHR